MWKLFVPFIVIIAVLAGVALTDTPRPRADFTFINRGDVSTLDLQRMSWMQDLRVARLLFEGLVRNDIFSHTYEPKPGIAERWELSPDRRTYSFFLRANAKWSNGQAVTAHDFVFSWRRALLPDTASDYSEQFQLIAGGEAFYAWRERALASMTLAGTLAQLPPGQLVRDADTLETKARRFSDVIWFFHEGRPANDDAGIQKSDALAEARRAIDRTLADARSARATLVAPDTSGHAPAKATLARLEATLAELLSGVSDSAADLRRLATERQPTGGQLWRETEAAFDALVHVTAVSDHELRVTLERPTPYFLDLCAFAVFYPVYPPLVRQYELPDDRTGRLDFRGGWTKPPYLISNGPFQLTVWRFKRDMRLERNTHYWNPHAIAIDSIQIPSVEDPNAQVLAFNSGGVDWVSDVTPTYRADMLDAKKQFYRQHQSQYDDLVAQYLDPVEIDRRLPPDPRSRIHSFPAFGTYFYNFNCLPKLPDGRANPFADARVRRAFAMAVDRERLTNQVRRSGEPPTSLLVPKDSLPGYASPRGVVYDPPAARALLAEAGYPGGKGFITVSILFNRDAGHDTIAQAIARDWQENLGVQVTLDQKEIAVVRDELKNHTFMVSRAGWFGDYGDPTTFLDLNRTGDGNNDRAYSNPRYDALLDRAAREPDTAARLALLSEAERIIIEEDLPLIPLFHYVQVYLFDPHSITGISSHPRQQQDLFHVDVFGDSKGTDTPKLLPPRAR